MRRLSADVGRVAKPLTFAIEIMAKLDLVTAKARYSRDYQMYAPDINITGQLWLRVARHPLLEYLFRNERQPSPPNPDPAAPPTPEKPPRAVIAIDIRLGMGFNLLIITGPNTGGKTVCLKTAGLLCLMDMQAGMQYIPAGEGSNVPVFEQIHADIGDEQSLEQSLSTFSSHISRIAGILKIANERSLVLLDELGAGTDPTEGAALGRAILDGLDQCSCRAMVTTHLGDLKTYAFHNEHAENGAVEFNDETLRPTYRLQIGQFGMSNALKIARRLKLPRDLLKRAHRYLKRRQKRAPEMAQLQRLREEAEKAKEVALVAQHEAERQRDELRDTKHLIEREAEEAAALHAARLKLQANDQVRVPKFGEPGRIVRVDFKKNTAQVRVGIGQWEVSLDEVFPLEK